MAKNLSEDQVFQSINRDHLLRKADSFVQENSELIEPRTLALIQKELKEWPGIAVDASNHEAVLKSLRIINTTYLNFISIILFAPDKRWNRLLKAKQKAGRLRFFGSNVTDEDIKFYKILILLEETDKALESTPAYWRSLSGLADRKLARVDELIELKKLYSTREAFSFKV